MSSYNSIEASDGISSKLVAASDDTACHPSDLSSTPLLVNVQPTTLPQWLYIEGTSSTTPTILDKSSSSFHFKDNPTIVKPVPILPRELEKQTPIINNKPQKLVIQNPNTLQTVPLTVSQSKTLVSVKNLGVPILPKRKFILAPIPRLEKPQGSRNNMISDMVTSAQASTKTVSVITNPLSTATVTTNSVPTNNSTAITTNPLTVTTSPTINEQTKTPLTFEGKLNANHIKILNSKIQSTDNKTDISETDITVSLDNAFKSISDLSLEDDTTYSPPVFIINKESFLVRDKLAKQVSILKRNPLDTKCYQNVNKNKEPNPPPVSDHTLKEAPISTTKDNTKETVTNTVSAAPQHKPERRRKSSVACRQDYDEVTFIEQKPEKVMVEKSPKSKRRRKANKTAVSDVQIVEPDVNMNEDLDYINRFLVWDNGIGSLPGSEIKCIYNKYNFLQILTKDEYIQIVNKKIARSKTKEGSLGEMCCLHCGCFGLPSEFVTPKYCSLDCCENGVKAEQIKDRNYRLKAYNCFRKMKHSNMFKEILPIEKLEKEKQEISSCKKEKQETSSCKKEKQETSSCKKEKQETSSCKKEKQETSSCNGSEEDVNENSQDKFDLPWISKKKGFLWGKYLEQIKAKGAPVKLFKDPFPYTRNGFKPGMKLEGVDPQHPSHFCVLTVVEVIGYRLRLHFDGYSDNYDFWVNADSMDIFPAGWCEKYGHDLYPPPSYQNSEFNWNTYIKNTRYVLAPKHLFAERGSAICPNGFRVGMKLEAVDRKNTALVCVATIADMMDNRFLIHFDSWDDIYDYWADPMSPYIHPVGWADKNGHSLTPPNDYPHPETFNWDTYLRENKYVPAPTRAFKQRPPCGFKKGMRLECVDKRVPRLVRVATVDDIREHQLRIKFDGWPDRYSYWVDSDSCDIHPVGWCTKTGHPIESPLTPADVYEFLECPTIGCRGKGHIEGEKNSTHSSVAHCPYSEENLYRDHQLSDRLLSPDRQLEAVVPVCRLPKEKRRKYKTKQSLKAEDNEDDVSDFENDPLEAKRIKKIKLELNDENEQSSELPLTNGYMNENVEQIWEKHTKYLEPYFKDITNPNKWNQEEVLKFLTSIPDGLRNIDVFKEHEINGPALLMLNQQDLIEILNIKIGPAVKLYSIIVLLRRHSVC